MLSRFVRNEFNADSRSTIGVEFATRIVTVEDKRVKAQVWDTGTHDLTSPDPPFLTSSLSAGRPQYRAITAACVSIFFTYFPSSPPFLVTLAVVARADSRTGRFTVLFRYYRGAHGALLLYDVTKLSSFSNIRTWVEELREHGSPHTVAMLIGNKTDLDALRVIPAEVAEAFAGAFLYPAPTFFSMNPKRRH